MCGLQRGLLVGRTLTSLIWPSGININELLWIQRASMAGVAKVGGGHKIFFLNKFVLNRYGSNNYSLF